MSDEGLKQTPEAVLIDCLDAIFQLLQATEKMASDALSISSASSTEHLEKILDSHLEGVMMVRSKLLESLSSLGITVIQAMPGDLFSPETHCAVQRLSGPEYAGKIARLIRYGYMKEDQPLRYAEVAIFY